MVRVFMWVYVCARESVSMFWFHFYFLTDNGTCVRSLLIHQASEGSDRPEEGVGRVWRARERSDRLGRSSFP